MNIYDAIMKAADQIEQRPQSFNFGSCRIPSSRGCGTPGCALGWIGHFVGIHPVLAETMSLYAVTEILGIGSDYPADRTFYERMHGLSSGWICDATRCARGLRLYAEKYHGHEKPKAVTPPDWKTIAASPVIPDHVRSEEVA